MSEIKEELQELLLLIRSKSKPSYIKDELERSEERRVGKECSG